MSGWEGRDDTGGPAGLRRSDKTTSSNPPLSGHTGSEGPPRDGRGREGPGGRQNSVNIVPPVSGGVTAADISRIVAVSQSVATTVDTASLAAV